MKSVPKGGRVTRQAQIFTSADDGGPFFTPSLVVVLIRFTFAHLADHRCVHGSGGQVVRVVQAATWSQRGGGPCTAVHDLVQMLHTFTKTASVKSQAIKKNPRFTQQKHPGPTSIRKEPTRHPLREPHRPAALTPVWTATRARPSRPRSPATPHWPASRRSWRSGSATRSRCRRTSW